MSILITRPEPRASRTKATLEAVGRTGLVAPLFTIIAMPGPRPKGRFAALVVTSINGAAGLSPASANLAADMAVLAVGDATAEAIRASGFTNVQSASGDNRALARLILSQVAPKFRLLLATGEDHKPGLPAALAKVGYEVATWLRYKAEAVSALPDDARDALAGGTLDGVMHYSRRASEVFLSLAADAGLTEQAVRLQHLCLSDDVAGPLRAAGCPDVRVASQPEEAALLALLETGAASPPEPTAKAARRTAGRGADPATATAEPGPPAEIPARDVISPDPSTVAPTAEAAGPVEASAGGSRASEQASPPASPDPSPKGGGMTGLALAGLAGGLVGAVAITFLAPVLNQAGIRFPNSPTLAATDARLSRLEGKQPAGPAAPGAQADQTREIGLKLTSLEQRLAELAARPQPQAAAAGPDAAMMAEISALRQRIDAAEGAARAASQAAAASSQAVAPRLADLERVSRAVGTPGAAANGSARLIMAERAARALAAGESFAAEAAALGRLGSNAEQTAILTALAGAKLATVPALRAELAKLRRLPSAREAAGTAWHERLLGLMDNVVRVRVAGTGASQSALAILERMDQALQVGDLESAAGLFVTLPEPVRQDGKALIDALQRRLGADRAIRTIMDDAVKALSGAG
ncbi:MAG: uroporphyrinogen-III synthase [Hyphomicrobiales bacterium]|nr:uroporphyrinogen-III synthase [Hyphomicrobiales bacterium]